jgi:hypothetical protein
VRKRILLEIDEIYLRQLDAAISIYSKYNESQDRHWSTLSYNHFNSLALAAIERIAGSNSVYGRQAHDILERDQVYAHYHLIGVVHALRDDVASGFLADLREIVRGELFSDFLDMADYLVKEGFKDAAAVMGTGVLESHLRQLCVKLGITMETVVGSDVKPKKADQMNSDLARNKVYSVLEQKNVTAWLDLRNKAAHAKYGEYTKDHVSVMLQGVRVFISHYPA